MNPISRRRFVGGAAVAIGLPVLHGTGAPLHAATAAGPARLLCYYVPNGIHMPAWTPSAFGSAFELPPILEPLAAVRHEVDIISGLRNAPADIPTSGHHAAGTAGFLTAARARRSEIDIEVGISLDQVVAAAHGTKTSLPSLQLGIEGGDAVGHCDNGFSCAYSRNISWAGPSTPLPKLIDPALVFDMMFRGYDPTESAAAAEQRRAQRSSVLDHVLAQTRELGPGLGSSDRRAIDELMTAIRQTERRIDAVAGRCEAADAIVWPEEPLSFLDHLEVMTELMVLALRCDVTRCITFMFGNSASNRDYGFLGVPGSHHELSHHMGDAEKQAHLVTIGRFEIEWFAHLLHALQSVPDGEGTLLDSTMVLFSSELSDGNMHEHTNLPVLLAGGASLGRMPGRHLSAEDRPLGDLHLSMLGYLDVAADRFGEDGTAPLPEV